MPAEPNTTKFTVGQFVSLLTDPATVGVITEIIPGAPEFRYKIFLNNKQETLYASQIMPALLEENKQTLLSLAEFEARLTALQICHPSLSILYSLNSARIDFIPYQFRPVLKFMRSDRPRLLIADEVGVGKTIEAGLILRELQSRSQLDSVLVICPKALVSERKWERELKRFDEDFTPLDGEKLRHCLSETDLDGVWPTKYRKAILSTSLFDRRLVEGSGKREPGLDGLDPFPQFDLVIVDEAHHLRNPARFLHRGVARFCHNAKALLFLTATPIQLGSHDLYVLLNLLRPDLVLDQASFASMAEPNPFIHHAVELARGGQAGWEQEAYAALSEAAATSWGQKILQGKPEFEDVCEQLRSAPLAHQSRIKFVRAAEEQSTFSSLINRTRRRDIGNFTTRKSETVETEFTPSHSELHDALLAVQARILQITHGEKSVVFLMTTLRRQAASCLYGLAPLIRHILTRRMDYADWSELDLDENELTAETFNALTQEIDKVLFLADRLDSHDPKKDKLLALIRDKQNQANNKLILFSSFRHTLSYLMEHLQKENIRVGLVHGGVSDSDRSDLRDRFGHSREEADAIDVLLSSEVGCEGLDYQFCDCLINYDLPWNPMRIEQRIGRIDRYGQKSEAVVIYNMVTPGTVDYDIYTRCLMRIGVFRQALGGSEEILGQITRELRTVAENLELTVEERQTRLQQLADNEIRLMQEQETLEDQQAELFGLSLPPKQMEQEVRDASSVWLSPAAIHNLIQRYLTGTCGGDEHILGQKPLKTLRLSMEARGRLLQDYQKLPRQASEVYRSWEKWLRGSDPHLLITFEGECAKDNRNCHFITPIHPLALQAARAQENAPPFCAAFRARDETIPAGAYPFAIYQWQTRGAREDVEFRSICANTIVEAAFLSLLEKAEDVPDEQIEMPSDALFDELEGRHYAVWRQARTEHQAKTARVIQRRRESLRASHRARISLLKEQRDANRDEKIRRMRDSEITSAEAEFQRRLIELDNAETQADILSQKVAYGVMIVE